MPKKQPGPFPIAKCPECKKKFLINQPIVEIQLGIPPKVITSCQDHKDAI